jgi:type I restriction enzyme M protein
MSTDIVQKLWGFCHTLRHDGIDYGDYIEQITYLLFLKMADEKSVAIPPSWACSKWQAGDHRCSRRWKSSGTALTTTTSRSCALGKSRGILGDIYSGAQNRFNNPVNLKKLVSLIDETEWTSLGVDVKAASLRGTCWRRRPARARRARASSSRPAC